MQSCSNNSFDLDVVNTKKKLKQIEKDWLAQNPKKNGNLALRTTSGKNYYKWKLFDNEVCQRVCDHGKTENIDCVSYSTRNSDAGQMFCYCKACGWYVTWSYC